MAVRRSYEQKRRPTEALVDRKNDSRIGNKTRTAQLVLPEAEQRPSARRELASQYEIPSTAGQHTCSDRASFRKQPNLLSSQPPLQLLGPGGDEVARESGLAGLLVGLFVRVELERGFFSDGFGFGMGVHLDGLILLSVLATW